MLVKFPSSPESKLLVRVTGAMWGLPRQLEAVKKANQEKMHDTGCALSSTSDQLEAHYF